MGYLGVVDSWWELHHGYRPLEAIWIGGESTFYVLSGVLWLFVGYEVEVTRSFRRPLRPLLRTVKDILLIGVGLYIGRSLIPIQNAPPWYQDFRITSLAFIIWFLVPTIYGIWDVVRMAYLQRGSRQVATGIGLSALISGFALQFCFHELVQPMFGGSLERRYWFLGLCVAVGSAEFAIARVRGVPNRCTADTVGADEHHVVPL